jgi:4'-phosphopantetheinyl transferase EntD
MPAADQAGNDDPFCRYLDPQMPAPTDRVLHTAIQRLGLPGIMIGHRLISPGDEYALLPEEAVASPSAKIRRSSGAARIVARELLARTGCEICAVPKCSSGAPIWPPQIVGSLAHDTDVAVAALAPHREFASIGIDVEPAEPLPIELLKIIATSSEQSALDTYVFGGRLLFVAKEAVYKAVSGLDRMFLNHRDVEVDFLKRKAVVRNGRTVEFRFCISTHLVVLAFVRRAPSRRVKERVSANLHWVGSRREIRRIGNALE